MRTLMSLLEAAFSWFWLSARTTTIPLYDLKDNPLYIISCRPRAVSVAQSRRRVSTRGAG